MPKIHAQRLRDRKFPGIASTPPQLRTGCAFLWPTFVTPLILLAGLADAVSMQRRNMTAAASTASTAPTCNALAALRQGDLA
ncbi:hypothetical protein [Pseudoxanthomonas winnipegensis]|uniref:Uncharacterized protein n=1 Tax=Pseudoxanthomonas winnipegensis TaxID=2480810 RepID=A0A4Q8L9P6_9GAMM|nr:hypothetical protein [Pseudoxanthomonas winnipegensis]RZZ82335.1 hypothetical protein EA662_16530 [Pseudoxanthomonas winnipegensis]TAA25260.1 hypothetical protein EA661_17415 [Pseudoxanthomonas winnipegensis]TAA39518.1 hypothetical protein EAT51_15035 [Pseudoxanthomonas winnipegensis]TBV74276.1 hypothetical protein EYC46_12645 [Pseudoxanthomonas winnipegensis]